MSLRLSLYAQQSARSAPAFFASAIARLGLALVVQHVTVELAGVDAVDRLDAGAERAGQPELAGDEVADLPRRRRDQPHLVALADVLLRELDGLGVEPPADAVLPDALGELDDVGLLRCRADRPSAFSRADLRWLSFSPLVMNRRLMPGERGDVAPGDDLLVPRLAPELEQARAAHQRVVDIEEREDRAFARSRGQILGHRHSLKRVPRLTLLGKPDCHLCDDARAVVEGVLADHPEVAFEELSILDDPALLDAYVEEIPVVLIDDRVHTIWRVDEARLRTALRAVTNAPHRS